VVLMGVDEAPVVVGDRRAPVFALPEDAVRALAHAVTYSRWRATPVGRRPQLSNVDSVRARQVVTARLAAGAGWLTAADGDDLLSCYGIAVTAERTVDSEATAVAAATELGSLWCSSPATRTWSTRVTWAASGWISAMAFPWRRRTGRSSRIPPIHASSFSHQEAAGIEMVAGIAHDPVFGSVIMCGLGGVHTELFRDRTLRLLPVTDYDAAAMWRTLRAAALLTGYRGSPAVDTRAWEDLLLRLGRLAEDLPEVAELDANPVIVRPDGVAVVAVKVRLSPPGDEPDPSLRALRGA
jgi:acyl-CoA synthetase (NDP forming)